MPREKYVTTKSLRDLCIAFIGKNMEYWCKFSKDDLFASGQEISSNPFDPLPSAILEEIRRIYVSFTYRCKTSRNNVGGVCQILQHLITPQLINLLLRGDDVVMTLLELASVRCISLKTLKLENCNLLHAFPKFEKLTVVNFSFTLVSDSYLHTLGTSCPYLRELDLSSCPKVTDYGIQGLCVSVNSTGMKDDTLGICKSIQSLILNRRTGVTKRGIKIALENLPALKMLVHDSTFEVLTEIALIAHGNKLPKLPEFALSVLFISHPSYKIGDLKLVLSMCLSIVRVSIAEPDGFTNTELLSLVSHKNLQKLLLYARPILDVTKSCQLPQKLTFDGGLVPLLKVIGSSLTDLEIWFFHGCDIQPVVEYCPNLQILSLENNLDYMNKTCREGLKNPERLQQNNAQPILKKLDKLSICIKVDRPPLYEKYHSIPQATLITLLSSPLLRSLRLCHCDTLTDSVLLSAEKIHNFKNLEKICFQLCHSFTKIGISNFMQEGNALKELDLLTCNNVSTKSNINYWKSIALKNNWEITIDAWPSDFEYD
ncbi:hypothetical protein DAPPUDRAFT_302375 [Daphnia pulex]|uniref:Uncharacterized protein n=1 Tax=Daphnia pulex TaxID=6669 RepID=E9GCZ5_DAPPU|nr:hypothetical protein DAPPUDRAFT_302375 [Daphnia pulex]|eukprot:EFX82776.1 hypothetical protein DAPPUDRAFT_302375 [Daphnia pulex]